MSFDGADIPFQIGGWDGDYTSLGTYWGRESRTTVPHFVIHECGFLAEGTENWNNLRVFGSAWRAYYFLRSGSWVEHGEERYELTPQQVVILPQSLVYALRSTRRVPQMWIQFSFVPAHAFYVQKPFCVELDPALRRQVNEFIRAQCTPENPVENGAFAEQGSDSRALYHQSMALLHSCLARRPLEIRLLPPLMQTLLQDINESPQQEYSCSRLAKRHGLNDTALTRCFRENLGESPSDYMQRIRLEKASQFLAFSDLSLEQIAAQLRFPNRHYFSRAFARHAGCGPATFRKRCRHRSTPAES